MFAQHCPRKTVYDTHIQDYRRKRVELVQHIVTEMLIYLNMVKDLCRIYACQDIQPQSCEKKKKPKWLQSKPCEENGERHKHILVSSLLSRRRPVLTVSCDCKYNVQTRVVRFPTLSVCSAGRAGTLSKGFALKAALKCLWIQWC